MSSISDLSYEHQQAIESMKSQLLIVLINRLGGNADIPVSEIDGTGRFNLAMRIDQETRVRLGRDKRESRDVKDLVARSLEDSLFGKTIAELKEWHDNYAYRVGFDSIWSPRCREIWERVGHAISRA